MTTANSLSVSYAIITSIGLSCIFCIVIFIAIIYRYKRTHLVSIHYPRLLFITAVSCISCAITLIFVLNMELKIQATVTQAIYLCQSMIPFIIISDHITKINPSCIKLFGIIYAIVCLICCIIVIFGNMYSYLILILNILSELVFIVAGFHMYYNPSINTDNNPSISIPIIPYILIRPIIIAFAMPVVWMHLDNNNQHSANYFIGYMSMSIISISILAILTMIFPLIFNKNNHIRKRKDGNDYNMPLMSVNNPKYNNLHTLSSISKEESQPQNTEPFKNNIHIIISPSVKPGILSNTKSIIRPSILSMPSLPPQNTSGCISITMDGMNINNRRDSNQSNEPNWSKKNTLSGSSTIQSSSSCSDNNSKNESTHSHFYSKDTNKLLGSTVFLYGINESAEDDEVP